MIAGGHSGLKPAFQAGLYLSAIVGLIMLANTAIRWSLADVYATQLSHHLDTVDRNLSNKNAEQWRLARQHLDRTLELRPAYARYFELAENFYQKLDTLEFGGNPLIQELAWNDNEAKALDYARRGLYLMPSWPYLWKRLAISKLALKQFDDELAGAIERALYLGPWERSVQYGVAIAGLNYWPILQDAERLHVSQAVAQALEMDRMQHSELFDTSIILSHANFVRVCEEQIKSTTQRQLHSYCP
ncbi:hypothetical protein [Methylomicrobium sp. Wu6]|uniref:hypothetical protein n=1 Tax=Methylomicrobium sp. Wu6 TaxID=3107928 RepID=UPI002DD64D05|nr:hypothetical protein [Methylomicrobium sp. Wu6]MEC4747778.1 hypothetical protein [Methylomicrobium sp. Wu6]